MRKRSEAEVNLLLYRSRKEMQRRSNTPPRGKRHSSRHTPPPTQHGSDWHTIYAPQILDFDKKYFTTANFIEKIRRFTLTKELKIFIDMRTCTSISPDAALVLAAEIQRAREIFPKSINGFNPSKNRPFRLLRCLGFHELLGFQHDDNYVANLDDNVEYIHMRSGAEGQTDIFPEILGEVFGGAVTLSGYPARNSLLTALSEALHNAVQHAYPEESMHELTYSPADNYRWWIAGYRDPQTKEIAFMFYDQGITIPGSLPKKWGELAISLTAKIAAAVRLKKSASTDGAMLAAAMEVGRSSTKKDGRGWGLSEMRALVGGPTTEFGAVQGIAGSGSGIIRLLSRHGSYIYRNGQDPSFPTLPLLFPGTLITWKLKGSDAVIWQDENDV